MPYLGRLHARAMPLRVHEAFAPRELELTITAGLEAGRRRSRFASRSVRYSANMARTSPLISTQRRDLIDGARRAFDLCAAREDAGAEDAAREHAMWAQRRHAPQSRRAADARAGGGQVAGMAHAGIAVPGMAPS
jgi:hypothetical protein